MTQQNSNKSMNEQENNNKINVDFEKILEIKDKLQKIKI